MKPCIEVRNETKQKLRTYVTAEWELELAPNGAGFILRNTLPKWIRIQIVETEEEEEVEE